VARGEGVTFLGGNRGQVRVIRRMGRRNEGREGRWMRKGGRRGEGMGARGKGEVEGERVRGRKTKAEEACKNWTGVWVDKSGRVVGGDR